MWMEAFSFWYFEIYYFSHSNTSAHSEVYILKYFYSLQNFIISTLDKNILE